MNYSSIHHAQHAPTVGAQVNEVQVRVHGVVAHGYRASKLIHASVFNEEGDNVGTVHDLVISGSGDTAFAVIGVGGFLGIDETYVAVPMKRLTVGEDGDDVRLSTDLTKADLELVAK